MMLLSLCKAKIHRATVTEANLNYVGSITIDVALMEASGIIQNERLQVVNLANGARLETYVIPGERDSGVICLNGAAAHHVTPGDLVILIAYALMTPDEADGWQPTVVFVDARNAVTRVSRVEPPLTAG